MRVLIAGFGNVLRGDDGFGPAVIRQLSAEPLPAGVRALDVGAGGMNFVLELMEGFDRVIVVDAVQRGGEPGTVYVFDPPPADLAARRNERLDPHTAEPASAMRMAAQLKVLPAHVTVVGCEPADCTLSLVLSPPVREAVHSAAIKIREMLSDGAGPV